MSRWPKAGRITVGGRPDLILEDRGEAVDPDHRWRAYLKGRSAGGFLTSTGPTAEYAARSLIGRYREEIAAIEAGIRSLRRLAS